ncbi:MAG: hypothetical protein RLZZ383_293 [Pseudomonadota bacterium]|jgi:N-ethylmaleimide reductase
MNLLTPVELGALRLRNRVVMAPMTRSRADASGVLRPSTATYYAQRATAGLLVTEAVNVSPDAVGSPLTPGIWTDAHVDAWRAVTDAVHREGGTIVLQLWHTGRVGHSEVRGGRLPVAPSEIAIEGQKHFTASGPKDYETPRALTTEEVRATVADFERGARNAKAAGFDGVELHGAFGYLPHQFLSDSSNQRTDAYGGSVENRARFVVETLQRLVGVWGPGRVGLRLSPTLAYNGMGDSDPLATYTHLLSALNDLPLAYLHLMRATPDRERFPTWPQDVVSTFAPLFRGALILNGGYDRDTADAAVTAGVASAVSFGAPFIANPDLVHRFAVGAALAEGDRRTFYGGGDEGYVDYPALQGGLLARPKGYWLVLATVTDPARFGAYTALAGPTIARYGGRVLARGDVAEVVEGAVARRPFLVEFPSLDAARACYASPDYQHAIALREGAAVFDIVVLEGPAAPTAPATA